MLLFPSAMPRHKRPLVLKDLLTSHEKKAKSRSMLQAVLRGREQQNNRMAGGSPLSEYRARKSPTSATVCDATNTDGESGKRTPKTSSSHSADFPSDTRINKEELLSMGHIALRVRLDQAILNRKPQTVERYPGFIRDCAKAMEVVLRVQQK